MTQPIDYLGIDIAKDHLDLHLDGRHLRVTNNPCGWKKLLGLIRRHPRPCRAVCEASGPYHAGLVGALHQAGAEIAVVNPRAVRDFARATGTLAKTDKIDAALIVAFARATGPAPTPPADPVLEAIAQTLDLRNSLRDQRLANAQRLNQLHDPTLRARLRRLLTCLHNHIRQLEAHLRDIIAANPALRDKILCLTQTQGIGTLSAAALLAAMPELGSLNRNQAAALAGLAPFANDSGQHRGHRHIRAGRHAVRQALYMPALVAARRNPVLAPLYQRLIAQAKPPKVALTALMRKLLIHLNAQIRSLQQQHA